MNRRWIKRRYLNLELTVKIYSGTEIVLEIIAGANERTQSFAPNFVRHPFVEWMIVIENHFENLSLPYLLTQAGYMAAIQLMWACGTTACAFRITSEYSFTELGRMDS